MLRHQHHKSDPLLVCAATSHTHFCFAVLTALRAAIVILVVLIVFVGVMVVLVLFVLVAVHVASSVLDDVAVSTWPLLHLKLGAAFAGSEPGLLHSSPCLFCIASRCSSSTVDCWAAATQTGSLHTERLPHNQLVKCQF